MHLSSHDPPRAPLLAFHCSQCQRLPCCFDFGQASPIDSKTSLLQPLAWRRRKKKKERPELDTRSADAVGYRNGLLSARQHAQQPATGSWFILRHSGSKHLCIRGKHVTLLRGVPLPSSLRMRSRFQARPFGCAAQSTSSQCRGAVDMLRTRMSWVVSILAAAHSTANRT